jgi:hypothetical protein
MTKQVHLRLAKFLKRANAIHKEKYCYKKATLQYINNKIKISIKCNECSLVFEQRPTDHVDKGYGCPECCTGKSEKCAREIMQSVDFSSGVPALVGGSVNGLVDVGADGAGCRVRRDLDFAGTKPTDPGVGWLGLLRLDGFNDEVKCGFEYNGIQHYEYPNYYHRTRKDFEEQQSRDQEKYARCAANGVKLVIIPHHYTYKKPDEMRKFVTDQLFSLGMIKN